jgi:spermidine synthase
MGWLYEKRTFASEKNGRIDCRRLFGRWEIFVDGFDETSRYLVKIWREAYRRLPEDFLPAKALMFGLAGGDNVNLLHERYPECALTAVEWDPVMVHIADELGIFPAGRRPQIVLADAAMAARTLKPGYDFVLVDIFRGKSVADAAFGADFFPAVHRLLEPGGFLVVNGFWQPEVFVHAGECLEPVSRWRIGYNRMAMFRRPRLGEAARTDGKASSAGNA